uniref:Uncharacterized protein n=1 Tax=Cacopsylla melanoneura TaxID=428564 RepID=A0A8D9A2V4_9HEMI
MVFRVRYLVGYIIHRNLWMKQTIHNLYQKWDEMNTSVNILVCVLLFNLATTQANSLEKIRKLQRRAGGPIRSTDGKMDEAPYYMPVGHNITILPLTPKQKPPPGRR